MAELELKTTADRVDMEADKTSSITMLKRMLPKTPLPKAVMRMFGTTASNPPTGVPSAAAATKKRPKVPTK
jgi:hypothetical protein